MKYCKNWHPITINDIWREYCKERHEVFELTYINIMCDHYIENHSSINSKSKNLLLNQSECVFANSNI